MQPIHSWSLFPSAKELSSNSFELQPNPFKGPFIHLAWNSFFNQLPVLHVQVTLVCTWPRLLCARYKASQRIQSGVYEPMCINLSSWKPEYGVQRLPKRPNNQWRAEARLSLAEHWITFLGWFDEGYNHRSILKECIFISLKSTSNQ